MTRPGALVTDRDAALLRSLGVYGFLSVGQVQRLHFPSRQTATRRVRRLRQAGLLHCALVNGFDEPIVVPTVAGLAAGGLDALRAGTGRLPAALYLRHALAVADFRIALMESLKRCPGTALVNIVTDTEREARVARAPRPALQASMVLGTHHLSHVPDAAFALERGDRLAAFYLEIDRGTEVIGSPVRGVGKFLRFYRAAVVTTTSGWLQSALQLERLPDAVRVLVVTTSPARVQNIRRACGSSAGPDPGASRIWLTDASALTGSDLLGPRWLALDPRDKDLHAVVEERS